MKRKTKKFAIFVALIMLITLFPAGNCYATFNNLDIAIYADSGTDARTIAALCQAFARMGHNPMAIAEGDLIHNRLTTSNFDVLVIPSSSTGVEDLNATININAGKILNYVSSGGGLIAIGAAAKLLCANSINNTLAIYGANASALNDVGTGMAQIKICNSNFGTVGTKLTTCMLSEAASFGTASGATPIALYSDTGANSSDTNAIVAFGYGNGQVCLVGPELELEERFNVDLSAWDGFYNSFYDPESELPLLSKIVEYVYSGSVLNDTIVSSPNYSSVKRIAVYTEHDWENGGSWPAFLPAVFRSILNSGNLPIAITSTDIINGKLTTSNYDAIVFPGGYAYGYYVMLDGYESQIRSFVNSGGGIMGICAGAYYLSNWVSWDGVDYDYPVNIFTGVCAGPLGDIAAWPGRNLVNIDVTDLTMGLNGDYTTTYYGGGYFYGGSPTPISSAIYEYGGFYNYQDAVIRTYYGTGNGRVVLTGPHLEAEEGYTNDWCFWDNYQYDSDSAQTDPESEWGLLSSYYGWIAGNTNATTPGWNGTTLGVRRGLYDTAGDSLGDAQRKSDNNTYTIGKGQRMELQGFGLIAGSTINNVLLKVRYSVQSGSTANSYVQWRSDGSSTYYNTTIRPAAGSSNVEVTYDLKAAGVDTLAEIENLVISYANNSSTNKTTSFDYVQVVVN